MTSPLTRRRRSESGLESLEGRRLLSASLGDVLVAPAHMTSPAASTSAPKGYAPSQIRHAYGFDKVSFNGVAGNGAGQTIAIVDAYNDPHIASDLSTFSSTYGLPGADLTVIGTGGSKTALPKTDAGWSGEIALDVEWAHAIAPAAKIVLVEAKSDSLADLLAAVDTARSYAGVSVVSMSWGTDEFYSEYNYDAHFTTPAGHTPITFVAASGDQGGFYGPMWPAVSPNVLSVGGTTLSLDSAGNVQSETPWRSSTGGFSQVEYAAPYESDVTGSFGASSPDVAFDADPKTGFAVYDTVGGSGWQTVGGTSAGAPQWAALIAIADQGRAAEGMASLDGASGTLPTLYSLYSAANYSSYFTDVPVTTTQLVPVFSRRGYFLGFARRTVTVAGYDTVTGLGSPEASGVVSALLGAQNALTSAAATPARAAVRVIYLRVKPAEAVADAPAVTARPDEVHAIPAVAMHAAVGGQNAEAAATALPITTGFTLGPAASAAVDGQSSADPLVARSVFATGFTTPRQETILTPQGALAPAQSVQTPSIVGSVTTAAAGVFASATTQVSSALVATADAVAKAVGAADDSPTSATPAAVVAGVLLLSVSIDRLMTRRAAGNGGKTTLPFNLVEPVDDRD